MKSKVVPKKLYAILVNGEFHRLRVFRNDGGAARHKIRMAEIWRGRDEEKARDWRSANIMVYKINETNNPDYRSSPRKRKRNGNRDAMRVR